MLRWLRRLGVCLGLGLLAGAFTGCLIFRRSLPQLEGERQLPGLSQPVRIERDVHGIPTLSGSNRLDLARALGFLHAQDRFFQMDLVRRGAAGELAEIVGPAMLEQDKSVRIHDLRRVARAAVAKLPMNQMELLRNYCEGVNSGLKALRARPPEYVVLRQQPRPWQPEDSILVLHAMGLVLSEPQGQTESALGVMRRALSPAALEFFAPDGTSWDAALDESILPEAKMPTPAEFTAAEPHGTNLVRTNLDPRLQPLGTVGPVVNPDEETDLERFRHVLGSNAFVVSGEVSATGSPILANDMHLELHQPSIWYRAQMFFRSPDGSLRHLIGTTLPGSPILSTGSNGDVAWGFTASALDSSDVIDLVTSTNHPYSYRVGEAWKPFERRREIIHVRGQPDVVLEIPLTIWGPVLTNTPAFRPQVVKWVMAAPETASLGSFDFESAQTVFELLDRAPHAGLPWLNVLAGDRHGNIGWTVAGHFPHRVGFDGKFPGSWADGERRWDGWIPPPEYPRVVNPPGGRLWSANQRQTSDSKYDALGHGLAVDLGARALQIRDDLFALTHAGPRDLLAIQLDDRALFLDRWQKLLLETLARSTTTNKALRREWQDYITHWGRRAETQSIGYRLIRAFRLGTHRLLFEPVKLECERIVPQFHSLPLQFEGPAWRMLTERPAHLLNRRFANYDALLEEAWLDVMTRFPKPPQPLRQRTWGQRNTLKMQHPFSLAFSSLSRWLDAPPVQLNGDVDMPRVQFETIGASQRMVIALGHEEDSIYHQPGGASGHFQSPYYLSGHEAWVRGEPTPLQPGVPVKTLILRP